METPEVHFTCLYGPKLMFCRVCSSMVAAARKSGAVKFKNIVVLGKIGQGVSQVISRV
jgi:hypothetical protein